MNCLLCRSTNIAQYAKDKTREYLQCLTCHLVFVPAKFHLSAETEISRYNFHQNNPMDVRYRIFLNKIAEPLNELLNPKSKGLDFGSGPGPTLNLMLEEKGHDVDIYDIFYAKNEEVFKRKYDFITATEVLEHLFQPAFELERLWSCLNKNGYLGIMTTFLTTEIQFETWHYKNDDTHVTFFSKKSFHYLAQKWHAKIHFIGNSIVIFKK